jgi:hypothetical protein
VAEFELRSTFTCIGGTTGLMKGKNLTAHGAGRYNHVYTKTVYTGFVRQLKNITLSASSETIERARLRAREQRTTLNEAFRDWLEHYSGGRPTAAEYRQIMSQLRHVRPGRKFTREEMNQRAPQS